jgi:hypothetical protein
MGDERGLAFVFFDIGNTLGAVNAAGQLEPFEPGSTALLSDRRLTAAC